MTEHRTLRKWFSLVMSIAVTMLSLAPIGAHARPRAKPPVTAAKTNIEVTDPLTAYLFYRYDLSHARWDSADKFLDLARKLDDESLSLISEQANFFAMRGDLKRARALAEKALTIDSDDPNAHALLGKIYATQGFHVKAVELYERAIRVAPEATDVYPLLIQEYLRTNDAQKAFHTAQQLLKQEPNSPEAYLFLGLLYDDYFKNPDKALDHYLQVLLYNPRDIIVLDRVAQIYILRHDYDIALQYLKKVENIAPDNVNTLLKIALIYYEEGKKNDAKALFETIAHRNPESDRVHYYLGLLYVEDNSYDAARKQLRMIPKTSDYYQDALAQMIASYIREKSWKDALSLANRAIAASPKELRFYQLLAAVYEGQGNSAAVVSLFTSLEKTFSDNPKYYYGIALYRDRKGDWEGAVSAMRKVLEIEPNNTSALNYIGYTYADRNSHLDEALSLLQKARALDPDNGYILDSLGWAYFRLHRFKEARIFLERARGLSPAEATILNHLGDLYRRLGKEKDAQAMYREGLTLLEAKPKDDLSREDEETLRDLQQKITLGKNPP